MEINQNGINIYFALPVTVDTIYVGEDNRLMWIFTF
jgi:hypothetical protein